MQVKKRYIWDGDILYSAWACPRCVNGTMIIEQERLELPPFYHCINCGHIEEIGEENALISEAKSRKNSKNKREKTHKKDNKSHFSYAQKKNK